MPMERSSRRARRNGARNCIGERGHERTDAIERADTGHGPRAKRHAVDVVVMAEELALERRHVDRQRALGLAGLAFEAEIERLVESFVTERGHGIRGGEGIDERVRAAAGRVLLIEGCHVGRAHRPLAHLAASADPHAAVCSGEHRPFGKGSARRQHDRLGDRGIAEILGHRLAVDDLPGIHAVLGVEDRFHLPHRFVQLVPVDAAVELGASESVAVLARVGTAELRGELQDLLRDRVHRLDILGTAEVEEGPDVQAANRAVAVETCTHAAAFESRGEPLRVLREVLRINGRVLNKGERALCAGARCHEQP